MDRSDGAGARKVRAGRWRRAAKAFRARAPGAECVERACRDRAPPPGAMVAATGRERRNSGTRVAIGQVP